MTALTHFSLFTGIGGMDMAAEWAGFVTVGQCELAAYPTKILEKHWPGMPRWKDIRDVTAESFYGATGLRTVDVISGGFPCQPFSVAGKQKGERDERHLWPEMLRVIKELRPTWVLGENVSGILRLAGDAVCKDLELAGYDIGVFHYEAAAVGAPHRRARVFFVGNAKHDGQLAHTELRSHETASHDRGQEEPGPAKQPPGTGKPAHVRGVHGSKDGSEQALANAHRIGLQDAGTELEPTGASGKSEAVANPDYPRDDAHGHGTVGKRAAASEKGQDLPQPELGRLREALANTDNGGGSVRRVRELQPVKETCCPRDDNRGGTPEHGAGQRRDAEPGLGGVADGLPPWVDETIEWLPEPCIPRIAEGIPNRAERIKALGNAVVPHQAYPIFRAMAQIINEQKARE